MAVARAQQPAYRRRRPQDAHREILEAAEQLLRARPYRDVSVDDVMAATSLSRPSFYQYFRDLPDLVMQIVDHLREEFAEVAAIWLQGTGDPANDSLRTIQGVVRIYQRQGPVMRALADAATHDQQIESAYRGLIVGFVEATAARIRKDMAAGRVQSLDPEQTATALIWMSERYLAETMGRGEPVEPSMIVNTLRQIWMRSLYLRIP